MPCEGASGHGRKYFQVCIFECDDGKHFFKIPKIPKIRKLWLQKLGLQSVSWSSRICNNHFSEDMVTRAGKRIKKNGFPDRNIRRLNGYAASKCEETSADHIESLMDNLCKEDISNKKINSESEQQTENKTQTARKTNNNFMRNAVDITLSSPDGSLMNCQLQKQNNVVDIPQFILVFTAFRANNTLIIPPASLMPEISIVNVPANHPKGGNKSIEEEDLWKESNRIKPEKPVREIRYVPYERPKMLLRREREIQADMAAETTKTTTAIQCDLDEQGPLTSDSQATTQLDWVNHLLENHVLNAKEDLYECHICGEIAASYASNLKHAMVHKERSSLCFECGRLFRNHVKLKYHEKKAHQPINIEVKTALRCPKFHCTKAFHSKRQLYKHIDKHTTGIEYKCEKCWRIFSSFLQFHMHKSRKNCLR